MRPRVKICGITSVEDAERCVELGADYIGLNFYPPSPRFVSLSTARRIARRVEGRCAVVAVVAGAGRRRVSEIVDELGPDLVQFHGDESAEDMAPWRDRALKALRVHEVPDSDLFGDFPDAWGFLLDARHDELLGGSGHSWSWGDLSGLGSGKPIFVAGGIGAHNVRRAAQASGAFAVDVCSGVEAEPGRKSHVKLEQLFRELRG